MRGSPSDLPNGEGLQGGPWSSKEGEPPNGGSPLASASRPPHSTPSIMGVEWGLTMTVP